MLLFRVLGVICLLIAMVAVVIDAIKNLSVMDGDWIFTSLGDQWSKLSPHSLATVESVVKAHAVPFLWDPIITELLRGADLGGVRNPWVRPVLARTQARSGRD
jgi:hypothetical protein